MRVLVACEFSGRVRDAFLRAGHDALSVDLLPTEVPGPHYEGDIFDVIEDGWDLMVAHPPCTFLALSGARWLYKDGGRNEERWAAMTEGAIFFRRLLNAPISHIAVENPVMHGHARSIIGMGASQIVHPWQHGHPETKATGLWLRNLPLLRPTKVVYDEMQALPVEQRHRIWWLGSNKGHERSRTFEGIAAAIADQWGDLARLQMEPRGRQLEMALA